MLIYPPPTLKLGVSMPHVQLKQKWLLTTSLTCMAVMEQTSLSGSFNQNTPPAFIPPSNSTDHTYTHVLTITEAVKLPDNDSLCGWTGIMG